MKKLIIIPFLITASYLFAQGDAPIVTDRPTQSAAASVVPQGNFLIEAGLINDRIVSNFNVLTFNSLFRYGLTDKIEIRLTQNYVRESIGNLRGSGFSPTTVGAKVFLASEDNAFANMSVIGQVSFPTGPYGSSMASYELRLNFQNTLSDNLSLGYNVGVIVSDDQLFLLYTAVLSFAIDSQWSIFAEPFGFINNNLDQRFNAGVVYLLNNNVQFDATFGAGLVSVSPNSFIAFGAAIGF